MNNPGVSSSRTIDPDGWVTNHSDVLFRYALTRLKDRHAAEEVVQDTFLAALKAAERFSGKSTERTWLVGIMKHKIVDYIRKRTKEAPSHKQDLGDDYKGIEESLFDDSGKWRTGPAQWTTDPSASVDRDELKAVFIECMNLLPNNMADAFSLRELEELSSEEICKVLNLSETNLWVILHRARLKLRGCMEKNWLEDTQGRKN